MRDRIERTGTDDDAAAPSPSSTRAAAASSGLLALQRSAGNAAVAAMLQGASAPAAARTTPIADDARTVRRLMTVAHFKEITSQGAFSMKDEQQVKIIELMEHFASLADPERSLPKRVVVRYDKLDEAIALIEAMQRRVDIYLAQRYAPDADRQARRTSGFVLFRSACENELVALREQKAQGPVEAAPDAVDASGVVQGKKTASLGSAMSWIAGIVGQLAPTAGDQGEAKLDVSIPLGAASLEIKFMLEVKRLDATGTSAGPTEIACDLVVGGGVGIPDVAKVYAALGGYLKAEGATADAAMTLISYGLYRRCRESEVIPRGLSAMIWGGAWGDEGTEAAEAWSLDVEQDALADDQSYVETGGVVAAGAEVLGGAVTAGAKAFIGKRHDKQSLTTTKGAPGVPNAQGLWFGQRSTARPATTVELSAEIKAGPFGGDIKFTPKLRSTLERVDGRMDTSTQLTAGTLEIRVHGKIPASGAAQAIAAITAEAAKLLKRWRSEELQEAAAGIDENDQAQGGALRGEVASGSFVAAEAVAGFAGAPITSALPSASDPTPLGLEVFVGGRWDNEADTAELRGEIRFLKEYAIAGASLVRRTRLLSARYAGGGWTFDTAAGGRSESSEEEVEDDGQHDPLGSPPPSDRASSIADGTDSDSIELESLLDGQASDLDPAELQATIAALAALDPGEVDPDEVRRFLDTISPATAHEDDDTDTDADASASHSGPVPLQVRGTWLEDLFADLDEHDPGRATAAASALEEPLLADDAADATERPDLAALLGEQQQDEDELDL